MIQRCYHLTIPGQYTSWLALLYPITDGKRAGWMALDITYNEGDVIPSITFLPVGEGDIAPYQPITPEEMRRRGMAAIASLQSAIEVATECREVRI